MNEKIIEEMNKKTDEQAESVVEETIMWLVFAIGNERFAIPSSEVGEIIRDVAVYHLPFLPSYVDGVINKRGDPCAVINPVLLLDRQTVESKEEDDEAEEENGVPVLNSKKNVRKDEVSLFLVLNRDGDQLCLRITDILFFHESRKQDVHMLVTENADTSFYSGTVEYNHTEIPVINAAAFELRLRNDLGSS